LKIEDLFRLYIDTMRVILSFEFRRGHVHRNYVRQTTLLRAWSHTGCARMLTFIWNVLSRLC